MVCRVAKCTSATRPLCPLGLVSRVPVLVEHGRQMAALAVASGTTSACRARRRRSRPCSAQQAPRRFRAQLSSPAVDTIVKENVDTHAEQERLYEPTTIPPESA